LYAIITPSCIFSFALNALLLMPLDATTPRQRGSTAVQA
jgi:hypothetical protein